MPCSSEPHLWKRGIGQRLVNHIADIALVRAASLLHVVGNPHLARQEHALNGWASRLRSPHAARI